MLFGPICCLRDLGDNSALWWWLALYCCGGGGVCCTDPAFTAEDDFFDDFSLRFSEKKKQTEWVNFYYYKIYLIMLCILYDSLLDAYYNSDIL